MKKPRISICIPTFNRADLIDQTLQSVLAQKKKPYEVIIVDNASEDNTSEIVGRYKKYGYKYFRNSKNIGMIGNINKCISLSSGEYISILPSDDLISPDWYAQWSHIILFHKAKVYNSSVAVVDKKNRLFYIDHAFSKSKMIRQPDTMNEFSKYCSVIPPTAATIFKKEIFDEIGLFEAKYSTEADVAFTLKMFEHYDIYYAKIILSAHRFHPAQSFDKEKEMKTTSSRFLRLENQFKILAKNYNRIYIINTLCLILATTNLYFAKLQFKKVFGTYSLIKKYFPDAFNKPSDWYKLLKIQLIYIKKALFGRFPVAEDRKQVRWLNHE